MKIEDQVVSLELAQKMKELGFEQESLFYWWWDEYTEENDFIIEEYDALPTKYDYKAEKYSAYTVAELGEMLPMNCLCGFAYDINGKEFKVYINALLENERYFASKTEADARAKMLIYLKENKLI
jgi:hypothetical protein